MATTTTQQLKNIDIDTSSPVMVTGSTGYIGGVLVKHLLEAGLTVHCPVRDPTNKSKIQHLKDIESSEVGGGDGGGGGESRLKFFKADLMDDGSYLESMKGCSIVFHMASPFVMSVPKGKEQEMLLDPAVKGTENVLKSAMDGVSSSSVQRVVLTSSVYAVIGDGADSADAFSKTGKIANEDYWNNSANVDFNPYAYSKILAEKAAWKLVKDESDNNNNNNNKFELVVINPSWVMGPGVKIHPSSESYTFVKSLGDGVMKIGCPNLGVSVVDVRDVAKAHIHAAFAASEKVAGQRFLVSGSNTNVLNMSLAIAEKYPNYPLPKSALPKWLVWLFAPFLGIGSRKFVWRAVDTVNEVDNAKSINDLEMGNYKSLATTMQDMFQQCIENQYIADHTAVAN